jgi:hypothetical protein
MDDDAMKELYAAMRARRPAAPNLDALLGRRPRGRRIRPSLVAVTGGVVLAAVATAIVLRDGRPDPVVLAEEIMAWRAPTDVLLDPALMPALPPDDGGDTP